jgi:putative serine protease PepD
MKRRLFSLFAACLIALGVLGDRVLSANFSAPSQVVAATTSNVTTADTTSAATIDTATQDAYSTASQSVVYILSAGVGSGSGIIYDANGDIVTNDHVVAGATKLTVTLNNGKTYNATIVGTDQSDDLAVIRINASGLTPAHFATAGSYEVAQTVLAIGSPLGLKQSVTSGLISGLHRVEQEPNGAYISDAVQTSAAINPGNSGGALVTLSGTVVGIPTLEQTSSTDGTSTQDIGFAIPSERVVLIANQLIASGKVTHTGRPYLGISPTDASSSASPFSAGSSATSGALVSQVSSSGPAAKAGVQTGDVITSMNGIAVTDAQDLLTVLATEKPGDTVTLKLDRNGSSLSVQVQLGELPA